MVFEKVEALGKGRPHAQQKRPGFPSLNIHYLSIPIEFACSKYLTDEKLDSDWWYLSPETGQHIALFSTRTLEILAEQLGVNVTTDGKFFHIFHRDRLTARASFLAKKQYLVFAFASFNAATSYFRRALSSSTSLLESDERNAKEDLTAKRAKK